MANRRGATDEKLKDPEKEEVKAWAREVGFEKATEANCLLRFPDLACRSENSLRGVLARERTQLKNERVREARGAAANRTVRMMPIAIGESSNNVEKYLHIH